MATVGMILDEDKCIIHAIATYAHAANQDQKVHLPIKSFGAASLASKQKSLFFSSCSNACYNISEAAALFRKAHALFKSISR